MAKSGALRREKVFGVNKEGQFRLVAVLLVTVLARIALFGGCADSIFSEDSRD
jgi:hypothetical protein